MLSRLSLLTSHLPPPQLRKVEQLNVRTLAETLAACTKGGTLYVPGGHTNSAGAVIVLELLRVRVQVTDPISE